MPPYVIALRRAWESSGLTLEQVGARCEMAPSTVYRVLNGRRKVRVDSVIAVAAVFGISALPIFTSDHPHA